MGTLILNLKNNREFFGERAVYLAKISESVAYNTKTEIIIAPATPYLGFLTSKTQTKVYCQGVDASSKGTAAITLGAIADAGASGTFLNHSDAPTGVILLERMISSVKESGLESAVFTSRPVEAVRIAASDPTFIIVEDPALIGSNTAISTERPEFVSYVLDAVRSAGYKGRFLVGAGIRSGEDVRAAVKEGADGVAISSGISGQLDKLREKLLELARPLGG
ncbi:MAG: triose-phosphate isomerase [Candidatus Micrarchaeota archaeon]|nr:triose-phosphate isomerase [Candidatus Micrarchaeota archaeon]